MVAVLSITFIFMPLLMMTSPPRIPGLHGPIHVIVMVNSGLVLPSEISTMVNLELKSPVTLERVVLVLPPMSHVETLAHDPSALWVISLDLQFFCRICALKADIFASVAASIQDSTRDRRPPHHH